MTPSPPKMFTNVYNVREIEVKILEADSFLDRRVCLHLVGGTVFSPKNFPRFWRLGFL
jgi:hypothetical protein